MERGVNKPGDARERILAAAVEILEREGSGAVTTRRIAAEAGVNLAAVNYYFGRREELIAQVMDLTLEHAVEDWVAILSESSVSLPVRLYALLSVVLEGMDRYPGIVRSHLVELSSSRSGRFPRIFSTFLDRGAEMLAGEGSGPTRDLRISLAQMMSSAIFAGLVPGLLQGLGVSRPEFTTILIRRFLGIELLLSPAALAWVEEIQRRAFSGSL